MANAQCPMEQCRCDTGQDLAGVVFVSAQPAAVFDRLSPNLPALRQALEQQPATYELGDGLAACRLAGQLLADYRGPRRLVVLSEAQASNWQAVIEHQGSELLPADTEVDWVICRWRRSSR